jgi:hypothetical protein
MVFCQRLHATVRATAISIARKAVVDFDRGWWFSATHSSPQLNHHSTGELSTDGSAAERERAGCFQNIVGLETDA